MISMCLLTLKCVSCEIRPDQKKLQLSERTKFKVHLRIWMLLHDRSRAGNLQLAGDDEGGSGEGTLSPESGAQYCCFMKFSISLRYSQALKTLLKGGRGWRKDKLWCQSINLTVGIYIYSDWNTSHSYLEWLFLLLRELEPWTSHRKLANELTWC